jgi:hypothetical protein
MAALEFFPGRGLFRPDFNPASYSESFDTCPAGQYKRYTCPLFWNREGDSISCILSIRKALQLKF